MRDVLLDSVSGRRPFLTVVGVFASVAVFLAALGLYGVLAYRMPDSLLIKTGPGGLSVFLSVALLFSLISGLACATPASPAVLVDPAEAFREG